MCMRTSVLRPGSESFLASCALHSNGTVSRLSMVSVLCPNGLEWVEKQAARGDEFVYFPRSGGEGK